jgi:hypothetical protein
MMKISKMKRISTEDLRSSSQQINEWVLAAAVAVLSLLLNG